MLITLSPCNEEYWEFVRLLRTDPRVLPGFVQQGAITPDEQHAYMTAHWREYLVALVDGKPAGFVGSVDGDIRVCTHPDFQRKGVAAFLVEALMNRYPKSFAKIKVGNDPSIRLFEACGFVPTFVIYQRPEKSP